MSYRDTIGNYKGIKRLYCKVGSKFLGPFLSYFEQLIFDMQNQVDNCVKAEKKNEQRLLDFEERLFRVEENVRNLNAIFDNFQNSKYNIEKLRDVVEMQTAKQRVFERKLAAGISNTSEKTSEQTVGTSNSSDVYSGIDYFDFENYFRGSQAEIKTRQKQYIQYFEGCNNVLDIGCGRGEFLELMKENQIDACGIDIYEEFIELCKSKELKAIHADAIEALEKEEKVGGIFASQLVEHLTTDQVVRLCELSYEKLEEGGCLIMETPNPTSLAIYTNAFYIDPSHQKPVHPLTLQYILQKAGFKNIEVREVEGSEIRVRIPELKIEGVENLEEFNHSMHYVQRMLCGSQDYAIIARK